MPSLPKNSFVRGQWAPDWWYDVDIEGHDHACRIMHNCLPRASGASMNRGGTQTIAKVKDSTAKCRLIKFIFSNTQSYWIEAANLYFRFYTKVNGVVGQVTSGGNPVEVVTPYITADLPLLKWTQMNDTMWIVHPNYPPAKLTRTGASSFTYAAVTFGSTVTAPTGLNMSANGTGTAAPVLSLTSSGTGGNSVQYAVTVVVGGSESPLSNTVTAPVGSVLTWTSVASATAYKIYWLATGQNVGYGTMNAWVQEDPNVTSPYTVPSLAVVYPYVYPPVLAGTAFCISAIDSNKNESLPSNIVYGPQVTSGNGNTLNWNASANAVSYNIYCQYNGIWGTVATAKQGQTSYTFPNGTFVNNVALSPDVSKGIIVSSNPFSGSGNYPSVVEFLMGRLVYANTNNFPLRFWGSRSADFDNFNTSTTTVADDSFNYSLTSKKASPIKWILPQNIGALIGTQSGVLSLNGLVGDGSFDATNVPEVRPQDFLYGCSDLQPVSIGNNAMYPDFTSRRFRDITYSIYSYGYAGTEISLRAQDQFDNTTALFWDYEPYPYAEARIVRSDGVLVGLSYQKESQNIQMQAWHWHDTQGLFEDVSSVPSPDGLTDTIYIVNRTINGQTVRFVEYQQPRTYINPNTGLKDVAWSWFLDCAGRFTGVNTASVAAAWLPSTAVTGLMDGVPFTATSDASGNVPLPKTGSNSVVLVGLPYTWELMPMHFEYSAQTGTTADKQMQIRRAQISLVETAAQLNSVTVRPNKPEWQLAIDPNDQTVAEPLVFTWEDSNNALTPGLFSGSKFVNPQPGNVRDATIYLSGNQPLPAMIQRIIVSEQEGPL